MILGFKKIFPPKIKKKIKIHTIREDLHRRWKVGMKIHFATGVRTPNYHQFMSGACKGVQEIQIRHHIKEHDAPFVCVDGRLLNTAETVELAKSDGFEGEKGFFDWFNKDFDGIIIHWTDKKY